MFGLTSTEVEALIARLPGGDVMLRKGRQQTQKDRAAHVEAIHAARQAAESKIAACQDAEAAARAVVDRKTRELTDATAAFRVARAATYAVRAQLTLEVREHETALRQSADLARIAAFSSELLDLRDRLRTAGRQSEQIGKVNGLTGKREPTQVYGNGRGIAACLTAIIAARERCEALPLEAHDDLDAEIAKIRATIPLDLLARFEVLGEAPTLG